MLVEAWALIEKEVPDWKLDIYGQGPLQKELQLYFVYIALVGNFFI